MNFIESFNKYNSVRHFFQPKSINELCVSQHIQEHLLKNIMKNSFHILLYGDKDSGKTTMLNCILNEYYNKYSDEDVIFIQGLKEHSLTVIKQNIYSFCLFPLRNEKKRTIVIDDIDLLNTNGYDIILYCMDNYREHINILISCTDKYKLSNQLLTRFEMIPTKYDRFKFGKIYKKIIQSIPIHLEEECNNVLMNQSNYSFRVLFAILDKLYYVRKKTYNKHDVEQICGIIDYEIFEKYTNYWKSKNIMKANEQLEILIEKGYTMIDILELYFVYIKQQTILEKQLVLSVIACISKYITYFYSIHESIIELYLITHDLILLL